MSVCIPIATRTRVEQVSTYDHIVDGKLYVKVPWTGFWIPCGLAIAAMSKYLHDFVQVRMSEGRVCAEAIDPVRIKTTGLIIRDVTQCSYHLFNQAGAWRTEEGFPQACSVILQAQAIGIPQCSHHPTRSTIHEVKVVLFQQNDSTSIVIYASAVHLKPSSSGHGDSKIRSIKERRQHARRPPSMPIAITSSIATSKYLKFGPSNQDLNNYFWPNFVVVCNLCSP